MVSQIRNGEIHQTKKAKTRRKIKRNGKLIKRRKVRKRANQIILSG